MFDLISKDELENIKYDEIELLNNKDIEEGYKKCNECNITMNSNINNSYSCPQCGYIKHITTENQCYEKIYEHYNVSNTCHMPLKYIGKNSYKLQQNLRNSTSNYNPIQESFIKKFLNGCNSESVDFIIPQNIIIETCELYKSIRLNSKVFRGEILKGVLASLVYYISLKEGITRKPKEIAKWASIKESDLSTGDKHIRKLQEEGILNIVTNKNLNDDYISTYIYRLNINPNYIDFLKELLIELNNKKIGNVNSRTSTKVTGLIYLLCITENINLGKELNIDKSNEQIISDEFLISISTFKLYYSIILKNKDKIIHVFEKNNITFPNRRRIRM